MNINTDFNDRTCTIAIEGEIDTLTSPKLEQTIADCSEKCDRLILDFSGVEYISSAGLRVVIAAHREMEKKDGLVIRGMNQNVKSVFSLTGFNRALNIEE